MNEEDQKNITSEKFFNLYQRISNDENVVKISDAPGITIIRKYDENTKYFQDGKKIFIKFYIRDGYVIGNIDMAQKNEDGTYTTFDSTKPYENPFTNFFFGKDENITFNSDKQKIIIKRKNKTHELSVNDFVDLLIKNHLADRLFWKRKINKLKIYFLVFIFWFMDSKYDWLKYYNRVNKQTQIMDKMDKKDFLYLKRLEIEPFFKYFKIYRKILFLFMVLITGVSFYFFENIDTYSCAITNNFCSIFKIENFNITNPILLFTFFIFLFLLHYLSLFLMKKVDDKEGFIYRLHSSSLNESFSLKI